MPGMGGMPPGMGGGGNIPGMPPGMDMESIMKMAQAMGGGLASGKPRQANATFGTAAAKKPAGQPARDLEPKMTIAVHEPSNSLVVTAPEPMFREVEKLARSIDERGEQMVKVVSPMNGLLYESMLQQVLLGESSRSGGNRAPRPAPRPPAEPKNPR